MIVFAKIYPILKLPRRFGAFDYRIPNGSPVRVGDIVNISFRHRPMFGLIQEICETTAEPRVIELSPSPALFSVSATQRKHLHTIATELGQSMSSILSVAFEGFLPYDASFSVQNPGASPSFSIPKDIITVVRSMLKIIRESPYASFATDDETVAVLAHALTTSARGQTIILVPRERDARFFEKLLSPFRPMLLTGKTKPSDRNAVLRTWKRGDHQLLVGTRQTVLIEPKSLETILVVQAACEDHGSVLRNPHIDAVRTATALAALHGARLVLTDALPPITEHSCARADQTPRQEHLSAQYQASAPQILDTTNRGESSGYPLLSQTLLEAIKTALHSGKRVLLSLNRKGVAKRLECKDCGHVPFCGTCGNLPVVRLQDLLCEACGAEMWKPTTCPACGSQKVGPRLVGGARIVDDLKVVFPSHSIGQIEKGRIDLTADIVVVTEYFWSSVLIPFHTYGFGLVAELLADVGYTPGDFRGAEKTARKIQRLQHFAAREHAECIIQTIARDRLLTLLGPEHVLMHECAMRQTYLLPPFGVIVTFEHASREDLPSIFIPHLVERHGMLTAKISREIFHTWQRHFPEIPDHINIRIQQ